MKVITLYILFCLMVVQIQAQVSTINRTYSFLPYKTSIFNSIVVTDSCYYITGIVADSVWPYNAGALFVKTDLEGNPLIVKGLTDTVNRYETWFQSLSSDRGGNLITHGYNYAQDTNTLFFIKYDPTGNIVTITDFQAKSGSVYEVPYDMVSNDRNQSMVCVSVSDDNSYSELWVVKLDQNGEPQVNKSAASNVNSVALNRITTTSDGGFLVGGLGTNDNVVAKNIKMQIVLTKLDSLGNKEWDYLSPANEDWFGTLGGIVVNETNEIVFGTAKGKAIPINSSSEYFVWDWCIIKMDSDRNILWETFFRTSEEAFQDVDQHLWNMIELKDQQGYVAVGQSFAPGPFWYGWIVKVAENGDSLWMRRYNFEGKDIVYELKDIKEDMDGNLVMVGEYRDVRGGDVGQKAWLLKVDRYGCLIPGCQLVNTQEFQPDRINLLLYPNPVNDFLSFYISYSPLLRDMKYYISDNQGRILFRSNNIQNNATTIYSVENFSPGTYFLQFICNNQIVKTEKFLVIH